MDTFKLKIFAITVMLIDHIGAIFVSPYHYWLYFAFRAVGRLAFPVFVFLIVEGFYHTHNIKKYLIRLGVFALISEIPFDLAFYQYHFGKNALGDIKRMFGSQPDCTAVLTNFNQNQNVFFTLFLGLLLITLMDLVEKKFQKNKPFDIAVSNMLDGLLTIIFCTAAYLLRTDYGYAGILMIVAFYLFRGSKLVLGISVFIISATLLSCFNNFRVTGNLYDMIGILATLAIIPISYYNGKKGKDIKYFFYIFYPLHLLCLFLIAVVI